MIDLPGNVKTTDFGLGMLVLELKLFCEKFECNLIKFQLLYIWINKGLVWNELTLSGQLKLVKTA